MLKIRIDPLDKLFSQYIRARDKCCQRCGGTNGLQCAHFHGRAKRSTRWDEDNAVALGFGCHIYFTSHPLEFTEWFRKHLGEEKFDLLNARARITYPKPDKEAIRLYLEEKIRRL